MFAHQVIEDILKKPSKIGGLNFEQCLDMASTITKAQKFHFGSAEGVYQSIPNYDTHNLWEGEWRKNINPPYEKSWFDCTSEHGTFSKYGFLLQHDKENEILYIHPFICLRKLNNLWVPSPVYYVIELNEKPYGYYYVGQSKLFNLSITKEKLLDVGVEIMMIQAGIVNFCLMLLNCKNVHTEIINPPEKLNIKRRKNGKQELFSYHVLNVTLPSQKQGYREKTDPNYHVRVHLCRGHFKEYTQEHPLFGSLTGRYWWQPHVRGQNHNGVVMKDYEVKQRAVA